MDPWEFEDKDREDRWEFEDNVDLATSLMRAGIDPRDVDAAITLRREPAEECENASIEAQYAAEDLGTVAVGALWGNRSDSDLAQARRDLEDAFARLRAAVGQAEALAVVA